MFTYKGVTLICALAVFVVGELNDWSEEIEIERKLDEDDYDLEMRFETAAKQELKTLSVWLLANADNDSIKWFADLDPMCPPPAVHHLNPALCDAPICHTSEDCREEDEEGMRSKRACCYNGCILTCIKKLREPPAFDWLEGHPEFEKVESPQQLIEIPEFKARGPTVKQLRSHPEVIALPGGCLLTQRQFKELEGFKESPHVKNCYCETGGILCDVSSVLNHR